MEDATDETVMGTSQIWRELLFPVFCLLKTWICSESSTTAMFR
jgi:hypothetical protein